MGVVGETVSEVKALDGHGGLLVAALVIIHRSPGIDALLNFNINYKYLSAQQGNNLTITLAPSTVLNAKWG